MNPLKSLSESGQSPWYDMISRDMLRSGELARLVEEDGLKGVTSNPSIFEKAMTKGSAYDSALREALAAGVRDPKELFERLAVPDIREAADVLRPVFDASQGADGFVSLEVSPTLAYDAAGTAAEAKRLFAEVGRPNVMIKIPATKEGLDAIAETVAAGIPVNVTLIFSLERYMSVMNAYLAGLERRAAAGEPLPQVASVASFFISRIDSAVDALLPPDSPLRGQAAIANAKTAYKLFRQVFGGERFAALAAKGGRLQRPLWASTSTKNPDYRDVVYVETLIGPDTVNTIPPATWDAFRDHGAVARTVDAALEDARRTLEELARRGVDLSAVTDKLEADGVKSFADAFAGLLGHLAKKAEAMLAVPPADAVAARIWARDAALWKDAPEHRAIIGNSLGWLDLPASMPERLGAVEAFAEEVRAAGFEHVVVLGMGGSSLACEVLRTVGDPAAGPPRLHVLDSTEPSAVKACEQAAPPDRTLYIVSSKSGSTVEPARLMDYFYARAAERGDAGSRFCAVTDPGSPLAALAKEKGFRKVFLNPPDVGGRFSALSLFGLVPAALCGWDARALLKRAAAMAEACRTDGPENPGLALGRALAEHARAGRDKLVVLSEPRLDSFGLWLEQLIAESVGKEGKGVVPVAAEPVREGGRYADDKLFILVSRTGDVGPAAAQAGAFEAAGRPLLRFELDSPEALGAEFFRWEFATAVLGRELGVDPFDQPDVQAAKEMTQAALAELKEKGALTLPAPAAEDESWSVGFSPAAAEAAAGAASPEEALGRFLALARPGDYGAVLAYLPSDGRHADQLAALRRAIAEPAGMSVQGGYGPRYLHSTGQLHKGGPATGLFLVLARDSGPDADIPGAGLSFGQLCGAQALGDFRALCGAGRRAAYIRLKGDPDSALLRLAASAAAAARSTV
ncbi:MAG: transaldolase [Elusimicrobia bacterium]|nr:transaldolase [Elusimicrobiota bacterium]